jgi:hypothetical protein
MAPEKVAGPADVLRAGWPHLWRQAMQNIVRHPMEPFGRAHAEGEQVTFPRVSWGAVLGGTVVILAVSLILWVLAVSIVLAAAHPDAASLRTSVMILWICAIITTIVGAFAGGWVAGYLPGTPRRGIAIAHAFLAWGLALIISFLFELALVRGAIRTATDAMVDAAALGPTPPSESYGGIAPEEPSAPYASAPPDATRSGPGNTIPYGNNYGGSAPNLGPTQSERRMALEWLAGAGWSWFGTWFLAGLAAIAGASIGVRRPRPTGLLAELTEFERERPRTPPGSPLTPAPTP